MSQRETPGIRSSRRRNLGRSRESVKTCTCAPRVVGVGRDRPPRLGIRGSYSVEDRARRRGQVVETGRGALADGPEAIAFLDRGGEQRLGIPGGSPSSVGRRPGTSSSRRAYFGLVATVDCIATADRIDFTGLPDERHVVDEPRSMARPRDGCGVAVTSVGPNPGPPLDEPTEDRPGSISRPEPGELERALGVRERPAARECGPRQGREAARAAREAACGRKVIPRFDVGGFVRSGRPALDRGSG